MLRRIVPARRVLGAVGTACVGLASVLLPTMPAAADTAVRISSSNITCHQNTGILETTWVIRNSTDQTVRATYVSHAPVGSTIEHHTDEKTVLPGQSDATVVQSVPEALGNSATVVFSVRVGDAAPVNITSEVAAMRCRAQPTISIVGGQASCDPNTSTSTIVWTVTRETGPAAHVELTEKIPSTSTVSPGQGDVVDSPVTFTQTIGAGRGDAKILLKTTRADGQSNGGSLVFQPLRDVPYNCGAGAPNPPAPPSPSVPSSPEPSVPSSPEPSIPASPEPTPGGPGDGPGLPVTGSGIAAISGVALALLGAGAVAFVGARRRRIRFDA